MTRGELAARQVIACQESLEPAACVFIEHEEGCEGEICTCSGTAWFKSLSLLVAVNADLAAEAYWLN